MRNLDGGPLSGVRSPISNLDRIGPLELGKCCQTPGGFRGMFLEEMMFL